jgi:hypothetical protein
LKQETCKPVATTTPASLKLTSLDKKSGTFGSIITIKGTGFDAAHNTVVFGTSAVPGIESTDGKTLTFRIPVLATQSCTNFTAEGCFVSDAERKKTFGTYQIYVVNTKGVSNVLTFTLKEPTTSSSGSSSGVRSRNPTFGISRIIGPAKVGMNDQIFWVVDVTGTITSNLTASIVWGDTGSTTNVSKTFTMAGEQALIFNHTYSRAGNFSMKVTISDPQTGAKKETTVKVAVGTTSPAQASIPSLTRIVPSRGKIGSQLIIQGAGFSPTGNSIHFGSGGIQNISSYNYGTLMLYSIPSVVSACDTVSIACQSPAKNVVPGRYSVSVTNALGQITKAGSVTVLP